MAFGSLNGNGRNSSAMAEINMVPLIDVMLVLLVIFMITAPMLTHSVVVDLPQVSSQQAVQKPDNIDLAVDAEGRMYWNDQLVPEDQLSHYMRDLAAMQPQPDINLRADRNTRYEVLAEILGEARRAGVKGMGFVTTPANRANGAPASN